MLPRKFKQPAEEKISLAEQKSETAP